MALKVTTANFLVAQASALLLDVAMATEILVKGLTGLTLPIGFEMSTINVSEMGRRIDLVVPSGGTYTPIDVTANFVPGDVSQQRLQDASLNAQKITTARFYLQTGCDFAALDLINDPGGAYYVGTYSPPTAASKNELYTNSISFLPAGSSILFVVRTANGAGATLTFVSEATSGGGATVTLSAGTWDALGFEVGDVCIVDYLDSGDPMYAQAAVIAGAVMTFEIGVGDGAVIPDSAGIAATQVHGATPIEVTGLSTACN